MRKLSILNSEAFVDCVKVAVKTAGVEVQPTAFKKEVVKTACLMIEEGFDLSFIHKSVAEYHAAAFIRHCSEDVGAQFYQAISGSRQWQGWSQELRFLSEIDRYRYSKFFWIPELVRTQMERRLADSYTNPNEFLNSSPIHELTKLMILMFDGKGTSMVGVGGYGLRAVALSKGEYSFVWWWLDSLFDRLSSSKSGDDLIKRAVLQSGAKASGEERIHMSVAELVQYAPTSAAIVISAFETAKLRLESVLASAQSQVSQETEKVALMANLLPAQQTLL